MESEHIKLYKDGNDHNEKKDYKQALLCYDQSLEKMAEINNNFDYFEDYWMVLQKIILLVEKLHPTNQERIKSIIDNFYEAANQIYQSVNIDNPTNDELSELKYPMKRTYDEIHKELCIFSREVVFLNFGSYFLVGLLIVSAILFKIPIENIVSFFWNLLTSLKSANTEEYFSEDQ